MPLKPTLAELEGYLDDTLSDADTARVEHALRDSEPLRQHLRRLLQERDRGEHSLGAVWRRERLTCLSREDLGAYLLGALADGHAEYVRFHVEVVGCPFCRANLADLEERRRDGAAKSKERRKKVFDSSRGYLSK
jgi:anti-sigma factor RsiW